MCCAALACQARLEISQVCPNPELHMSSALYTQTVDTHAAEQAPVGYKLASNTQRESESRREPEREREERPTRQTSTQYNMWLCALRTSSTAGQPSTCTGHSICVRPLKLRLSRSPCPVLCRRWSVPVCLDGNLIISESSAATVNIRENERSSQQSDRGVL